MPAAINRALMRLPKRAESNERSTLVDTFVDVGPLFTLLSSQEHQVFYGRRGTGKTHALLFLADSVNREGSRAVYVDLRSIGSTGGIYSDSSVPLAERATRLLLDVLGHVHEELTDFVLDRSYEDVDFEPTRCLRLLDRLAEAITEVRVIGPVTVEAASAVHDSATETSGASLSVGASPGIQLQLGAEGVHRKESSERLSSTGEQVHRVHFGSVAGSLTKVAQALPTKHLWLLLDEWSAVPVELQPYLADLLRRSIFPVPGITVKIGAIEQRSSFRIARSAGDYTGIELGADASADLDLDDFMVFGNNADRAKDFFRQLLFKHFSAVITPEFKENGAPSTSTELVRVGFTQSNAFDEFVRAAEGVPRDAINVLSLAAQHAGDGAISVPDIRSAARNWYLRDKETAVGANPEALRLLHWIIDNVIGKKQTKGFLLDQRQGASHTLIGHLYDERVLHVVRRGISSRDKPGVRFNAYGLDYGCYIHLTAAKAPKGLFYVEGLEGEPEVVDVPGDDYRSIRTALLDLATFDRRRSGVL
jgi:hypothetical protein